MKIKFALSFLLFITLISTANAQEFVYDNYTWEKNVEAYKPSNTESDPEIVLYEKIVYQLTVEDQSGYEYFLRHKSTFVNSDNAIENNNKIYLPTNINSEILKLMVRVIKPNNTIIEMNDSDIKEAIDEESQRKYKYMAVRGIEKGCTIEQIYAVKGYSDFNGRIVNVQSTVPKKKYEFEFLAPKHLVFEFKSYNGFSEVKKDTSYKNDEVASYKASLNNIAALKEEKYSNREQHIQSIALKLTGNLATRKLNINSYDYLSNVIFQNTQREISKAETKAIDKIIAESGAAKANNLNDKIRSVEDYIKKNIFYVNDLPEPVNTFDAMLSKKVADENGLTYLFSKIYEKLNVEFEILVTCNRFDIYFTNDFESLNFLDKYFLYFPTTQKYLSPSNPLYRYGLIPYQFRNHYGLFIKKVSLSDFVSGMGEVRFIETDSYLDNNDSIIVKVDFSKNIEEPLYNYRLTFDGHEASQVQSIFDFILEEDKKIELKKGIFKTFANDATVQKLKSENEGSAYFNKKPFVLSGEFNTSKYTSTAGNKILFNVGELIGPQEQMYQEGERQMPIEMNYTKNYFRHISFSIPNGYKISNLDKLNMNVPLSENNNDPVMLFRSQYEEKNGVVNIYVEEYYKTINLPIQKLEDFKKVINAAADFNKIVLVLEQK